MDNTSKVVIDLIRKAVDDSCHIDQQLLKQANWSEVMAFCLSQGVVGICYDAIEKEGMQTTQRNADNVVWPSNPS